MSSIAQPFCSGFTPSPTPLGLAPGAAVDLGSLPNYLFFFADGSGKANWQSASKGYYGDVAINGVLASESTSGTFGYGGTIYTNDSTLDAWQGIVDSNSGQAFAQISKTDLITQLQADFDAAWADLNARSVTHAISNLDDLAGTSLAALGGFNFQNGVAETIVVDITSGFSSSANHPIYGDAGDMFVIRWDKAGGYSAEVKLSGGGGIVPVS